MLTEYLKSKYVNRLNIQRKEEIEAYRFGELYSQQEEEKERLLEKRLRKKGQVLGGKKEKGYIQKAKEKSISKEREMDDYRCQMLEFKENSLKKRQHRQKGHF